MTAESSRTSQAGEQTADGDPPADPAAVARSICLRLLTAAPRTRAQLAEGLARRGVEDEVAEHVLDRLEEVGLVDDAGFAEAWVQSRHLGRGLARHALEAELRRRGVAEETANEAVATLGEEEELATARHLVQRRLAATRGLSPAARFRRLAGMLARKGYPRGLATRLVREALESEGEEAASLPEEEDGHA